MQDAMSTFSWSVLVPRLFDRVWSELRLARFPSFRHPVLSLRPELPPPADAEELQNAIDALTPVCGDRSDDVLRWDPVTKQVLKETVQQHLMKPSISCPSIIMLISWWDRSVGVCQDAAQLAVHWGHIPLLPASILSQPVSEAAIEAAIKAGGLPHNQLGKPVLYRELCAGSVIFSLSVAYSEVVAAMKAERPQPLGTLPMHKYW